MRNGSLIDRIIDVARGARLPSPGELENRGTTRVPFLAKLAFVQIEPCGDKAAPSILVAENISSGGLCVQSPNELFVGGRGALLLPRSDGEPVIVAAKVVYCNSFGTKAFECGLEFEPLASAVKMTDFHNAAGDLPDLGVAQAA